jgi:hypothetical protein
MQADIHVVCPGCGGVNRAGEEKLQRGGRPDFGACGAPLFAGPIELRSKSIFRWEGWPRRRLTLLTTGQTRCRCGAPSTRRRATLKVTPPSRPTRMNRSDIRDILVN